MGREIKRVSMADPPEQGKIWPGYVNPHWKNRKECRFCGGSGYNEATKRIADDWYDFAGTGRKWCYRITQDEVQALVDANRLWDFVRVPLNDEQRANCHPNGWTKEPNGRIPTADEVNTWAAKSFGHDAINRCVCVKARAERLGVYGLCEHCGGDGEVWSTPEAKAAYEAWEPTDPPVGDGWQIWETVSEGSPISPAFATPEELARWYADNGDPVYGKRDYDVVLAWIRGPGWCPSSIMVGGKMVDPMAEVEVPPCAP